MKCTLISPSALTPHDLDRWIAMQQGDSRFDSPFFRPEFVADVAAVRSDVHIARLESNDNVGFLPLHIENGKVGRSPAATMSDFEGALMPGDMALDVDSLLSNSGMSAWRFHHLIAEQHGCEQATWATCENPYLDLSDGFDAYRDERRKSRGRLIKEIERKLRKAERELASVDFTFDDRDPAALDWIVDQKSRQLAARGEWNFLTVPWAVPLYRQTLTHREPTYRGLISTLRHDGEIVAAHMGLQSRHVLHAWTHVFDPAVSQHSPGMVMLYLLAQAAAENGVTRIDLGRGDEGYKSRFANGALLLSEGAAESRLLPRLARRVWYASRETVRQTSFAQPAQSFVRRIRNWARAVIPHRSEVHVFSDSSRHVS